MTENYLLDTCALLYLLAGDPQLPPDLRDRLADAEGSIFYSPVNLVEIQIKYQLGKLVLSSSPEEIFPREFARQGVERLPLEDRAVYALQKLPLLHRDPFDRLLIAQAVASGCVLVTPDENIRQYPVNTTWN